MTPDEIRELIDTDADFVYSKRFDNSLQKFLERYPDGTAPPRLVAQVLQMTEEEVEEVYQGIVSKIRSNLKIQVD